MVTRLVTPQLSRLDDEETGAAIPASRPVLRTSARRSEPKIEALVTQGFVTEARPPSQPEPDDITEGLTIEVPLRLKRALLAEVADRRADPERRAVASMKSVILEALAACGFQDCIRQADIEVQAGIFMKRQSARLKRG